MNWLSQCREWVRKYDPVTREHLESQTLHHYAVVRALSEKLPSDAIVVYDTGGNAIMVGHAFRSKTGQRIFSSNSNTPMGFAMCGAIGAWFSQPDRPIICLIGDGGGQLNSQEMQTIFHYKVPVKVFILNNKILANTLLYQVQNGKQVLACNPASGYSSPNFANVARAYGLKSWTLEAHDDWRHALDLLLTIKDGFICDVVHENFCDFKPRMTLWNAGVEEVFPPLPEEEFRSNMIVPPMEGWEDRRKLHKEIPDEYKG